MNILLTTPAAPVMTPFSTIEKRIPMGMAFLIAILKKKGHNVYFIDNYLQPNPFLENNFLVKNKIDCVGVQANTICLRDTLRMLYSIQDLREKNKWNGIIVVGGPHASVSPETIPEFVDHVIVGEGEYALADVVNGKVKDRIVEYPAISDLDALPRPDWESFVHLDYQWSVDDIAEKPVFSMNTSRGCPFRCAFCSVGSIWGKKYRSFSASRIIDDICYLKSQYHARAIYFREDNFTYNRKRVFDFCELLIRKKIKIKWLCESRVNNLDSEILKMMHQAGCQWIYFGLESGSQKILDILKKDITVEQIYNALKICQKKGIKTYGSFITGVPGETKQDQELTSELINKGFLTSHCINVFVGIPQSPLYKQILSSGDYQYKDDRGLLYLKGHDNLVERYYGKRVFAKVPDKLIEDNLDYLDKAICLDGIFNLISGLTPNFKTEHFIARHRFLEQFLKPGINILDMNSHLGISTLRIKKSDAIPTGIVASKKELKFARDHLHIQDINLILKDQLTPEHKKEFFDIVVSFDYIEQTSFSAASKHIKKCRQFLKSGGILIGTVHLYMETFYPEKYHYPFGHDINNFSLKSINRLLIKYFRDINYYYNGNFLTFVAKKKDIPSDTKPDMKKRIANGFLFPLTKDLIFVNKPKTARSIILKAGLQYFTQLKIVVMFFLTFLPKNIIHALQRCTFTRSVFERLKNRN